MDKRTNIQCNNLNAKKESGDWLRAERPMNSGSSLGGVNSSFLHSVQGDSGGTPSLLSSVYRG
jgi:hypothetical protein